MSETTFPLDWNEWRAQWLAWKESHSTYLASTTLRVPGKNFLADGILGTWAIHYRDKSGRAFELSEVTMPDFSKGYGSNHRRLIGITWIDGNGKTEGGGVVESFEELEEALGLKDAWKRGERK